MIIKLKDILTIYINPDHNEKYHNRKIHMDALLEKLEFTNVVHYKSSSLNYPFCLNLAYLDIFIKYKPPFLLLEDDVEYNFDTIPDELEIPDNTDGLYLGLSTGGGHKINNYDHGNSSLIPFNSTLVKVKNMLTTHAVLYLNLKYMMHIRNLLILYPHYYNDVLISQIQNKYNIYALRDCYFYQSSKLGGHEKPTKISITNTTTFVTAFIKIDQGDYTNYFNYFEKLCQTGLPIALFLDIAYKNEGEILLQKYKNVQIIQYLDINQLPIYSTKKLPSIRNETKDTSNYMRIMNNKMYFMHITEQTNLYTTDYYAWIDFRIFHIFKKEEDAVNKLKELSIKKYDKQSYFPGALENKINILDEINWRFLGGFFLLHKEKIKELYTLLSEFVSNSNVFSWEVNNFAALEYNNLFDFGWYIADHNESILEIF